ncbi:MAG: hypothetical protein J6R29_00740 [Clostridia bacterium]|nr:hypothetical protein [Clostridia bacterium]
MKKLTTLFALLLASLFLFTGCVSASITYDGEFWNKNPAGFTRIEETTVYDVKVVNTTPSYEDEIKNEHLKLEISDGTYTVTLKGVFADANYYVLETELIVKGQYVYGENTIPVDDYVKTYTKFKSRANGFTPVYSMRTTFNEKTGKQHYNTSMYSYASGYVESNLRYEYSIEYSGKDATSKLVYGAPIRDENTNEIIDEQTIEETFTYKNYNDGAYIDNNLITFLPRAFNIKDDFYKGFSTIDVSNHEVKKMFYTVSSSSNSVSQQTFENLTYDYLIDGTLQTVESGFPTLRLYSAIDGTFTGAAIELYYASDASTHRHRLIKSYSALNDNMGFIEYTIKSVNLKETF